MIAVLLLLGCVRESVCFGECDTGADTDLAPTYEGAWSGTISLVYTGGWGEDWPCEGPASGEIDAELAFTGDATCGEGDQAMTGPLVGAVSEGVFTATWTPDVFEQDPQFHISGSASFDAIEGTFGDAAWSVEDGALSMSPVEEASK